MILPALLGVALFLVLPLNPQADIPLAEHPRPDFERADWLNLNGPWEFRFDADDEGKRADWMRSEDLEFRSITVPFPWGSELSGVDDEADLAWYRRSISVPADWQGQRIFVVIGACDWLTEGWLDGQALGEHRGGYTPFEFELTPHVRWGKKQSLVLRVDDTPHDFKLEGKQGYGEAKGIWQTIYLEARPLVHIDTIHFTPSLDNPPRVGVEVTLNEAAPARTELTVQFKTGEVPPQTVKFPKDDKSHRFEVAIPQPRLWSLEDPFLYEVDLTLSQGHAEDHLASYFGMRSISVEPLPGHGHPWIALNGKPIYLQLSLDQSYHPEGYYTFPSDAFMRDEILRSKRIGLNGNRFHVKIDIPRKLYWADRLGLLVMADVPNSWGEPGPEMRREIDYALRQMIRRDFNHPSIFSWVPFNETWGLFTQQDDERSYLPETQDYVASVVRLTKALDPTRLVEDNSPCHYDHVETDINSWHAYLPGYAWREHLAELTESTFPGSEWNFIGGRKQAGQPLFNSECGNVWGYEGSAGDVDWTWDYHIMMNEFRRHPKVCGWLYTEHHDVINEWNGYYRFDRSDKETGLDALVPGMSLRDLHAPYYLTAGSELCRDVEPSETVEVPLFLSFVTDVNPGANLRIRTELYGWDTLGRRESHLRSDRLVRFKPWMAEEVDPLSIRMPSKPGLAILTLALENEAGLVLHRNFTTFRVTKGPSPRHQALRAEGTPLQVIRVNPADFSSAAWSLKQWNILDGLKVNGAGHGHFEYRLPLPSDLDLSRVTGATFLIEASAKRLNGKDRDDAGKQEGNFMRGKGTHDPSLNPNSYPMTDTVTFPSAVRIRVNGISAGTIDLPDDPADHRGILSWHAQPRDRKLREAGSYGYLVSVPVPTASLESITPGDPVVVRLEVDDALAGGLAIYGEQFGRYPVDPTLILHLK